MGGLGEDRASQIFTCKACRHRPVGATRVRTSSGAGETEALWARRVVGQAPSPSRLFLCLDSMQSPGVLCS